MRSDTTHQLEHKCRWLSTFGKTKKLVPSSLLAYQSTEEESSQASVEGCVAKLLDAELPVLEHCRRRKVSAILCEARKKILAYKAALGSHREALLRDGGTSG